MKPTLLLLAAGMGSRYGGLKQLDGLGPNGETIMDYSIYDAIQAGFGKIVFIIRKDFEEQFREKVLTKYEGHVPVELCFQSLEDRKSTRLNSSHANTSYAVFCLKQKNIQIGCTYLSVLLPAIATIVQLS